MSMIGSVPSGGFLGNVGNLISGAFDKIGALSKERPEMFGMILDQMGSRLAPASAMAGIGTGVAQSILANKELQAQRQQQMDWNEFVKGLITGNTPLTAAEMEGVTKMTLAPGKDGKRQLSLGVTMPEALTTDANQMTGGGQAPQTPAYKSLGGMINDPF